MPFFAGWLVCFFEFLPRFGWHRGVEKTRRSLFFAGDSVFVAKAGPLTCGCSRMFLLVIAVVGDNIATMRDMKVGISERKRVFQFYCGVLCGRLPILCVLFVLIGGSARLARLRF